MTRKTFIGYSQEDVLNKSKGVEGITDIKYYDELGVWKLVKIVSK